MNIAKILHYTAVGLAAAIPAISVACSQGNAFSGFLSGKVRQPGASDKLAKILFYGLFAIELPFVLSFVVAISILAKDLSSVNFQVGLVEFGAALSLAISASCVSLAAGRTLNSASHLLARQPQHEAKLNLLFMLLLTFLETPVFFCFIVALFIFWKTNPELTLNQSYKLFSAALTVGIGSIGPSIAQFLFTSKVCQATSFKFSNYPKIFSMTIVTEALIESAALLSFMVSLLLLIKRINPAFDVFYTKYVLLVIPFCASLGGLASTIGIGYVGSIAVCEMASSSSEAQGGIIFRNALISQILIETCSFLCIVIVMSLLGATTVF